MLHLEANERVSTERDGRYCHTVCRWNLLFYLQPSEARRLDIASVVLTDIELAKIVLEAVERKQTSNRKKSGALKIRPAGI